MMNQLFLIRGLPGSGKSTLASQLTDIVFEADMFFLKDGVYQFDKEKIAEAHEWCQARCKEAMQFEVAKIAVSNTFVRRWEMEPYYRMAKEFNYRIVEITMSGNLHENAHGVSDNTIQHMRARWEK